MRLLEITSVGTNLEYRWPSGNREEYPLWIEYRASGDVGDHKVRLGFGVRLTYGRTRPRVVVWIDDYVHAEFVGADDFDRSGDVLSEIKLPGEVGERMCRYPDERIPERYSGLPVVGLPTRIVASGVHNAWAVVANIGDHRVLCALACLRRLERVRS